MRPINIRSMSGAVVMQGGRQASVVHPLVGKVLDVSTCRCIPLGNMEEKAQETQMHILKI